MYALLRKFAGQLAAACLLLGILIPADALAQAASTRESSLARIRKDLETYKKPPAAELEQRMAAAEKVWDAGQGKGLDDRSLDSFVYDLSMRTPIADLDKRTSAAEQVLNNENMNLSQTSLSPRSKGVILNEVALAGSVGLSAEKQQEIFDTLRGMESRINELEKAHGAMQSQSFMATIGQQMLLGNAPEQAKERGETLVQIGENLKAKGFKATEVNSGTNAALIGMGSGLDNQQVQKAADLMAQMRKQQGMSDTENDSVKYAVIDALKKGVSDKQLEEIAGVSLQATQTALAEHQSTIASRSAGDTAGESKTQGKEDERALADGQTAGARSAKLEKEVGQQGAAAAQSTIVKGTVENQANTDEAARAAAETGQKASDEGKGTAVGDAGANAVGQAMLAGRTREDADKIGETVETAAEKSLAEGQGTDAMNVGTDAALDVLLKAGGAPQAESTEAKTEEKEEEETTTQPTQTEGEEKEETPTQPTPNE